MKVKNTKAEADTWVGQVIESGAYYTIERSELGRWRSNSKVMTDLGSGALLLNDELEDIPDVAKAINTLLGGDLTPRDSDGSAIMRPKATTSGWSFQMHSIGIDIGKFSGIHNKSINGNHNSPDFLTLADLGFSTIKLYKQDRSLITAQEDEAQAHFTVVDWQVNHEMEILGGLFTQGQAPTNDIWMWTIGAPGIANVPFGQGGINLKRVGTAGWVDADGKAAKYLHPSVPMVGVNKMRIIFHHPTYEAHPCQMIFKLFKP